jgi:phage-related tail protein
MEKWYILQIILDIYLCSFVIYYIVSYRKKEYAILKDVHDKDESDSKRINETLKNFLVESEAASQEMIQAFKQEHTAIKQSINYINMKLDELNDASKESDKILKNFKEEIPTDEVRTRQDKLKYQEAANLLREGFAPGIIASRMKMPVGEVELVSRLSNNKPISL